MEYTFRNDDTGTLTHVEVKKFQLAVRREGKEQAIPFSAITHVCLERKKNFYFLEIRSTDFGSVRVCFHSTRDNKVQSRQYNSFIQDLHYQLIKSRCPVEYCTGIKPSSLVEKGGSVFLLTVLSYSIENYFHFTPLDPVIFAMLMMGLGGVLIAVPYFVNRSKNYLPTDIPLNMLPPLP
jgi:hypothetical protein